MSWVERMIENRGGVKLAGMTLVALALLIPLRMVEGLVGERQTREAGVRSEIEAQWGGEVGLAGPILEVRSDGRTLYLFPERVEAKGELDVIERYRGLFRWPTFQAAMQIEATFQVPDLDVPIDRSSAHVLLAGTGETPPESLSINAGDARVQVSGYKRFGTWLYAIPYTWGDDENLATATLKVSVPGTERITLEPSARNSEVALTGNWGAPSFEGDRLPTSRQTSNDGFEARWSLSHLGDLAFWDGLPEKWPASKVGVRLIESVSRYQVVTRTVKYAFLVIVLTFATFFLVEVVAGLHIHLVQYSLVGLALVMFYLLLLSQSEHMAFGYAYLIASGAVVALVTIYTRAILATTKHAAVCGIGLATLYGVLYPILREERYALLTGSWALFLLLATVMWVTRKTQWLNPERQAASAQQVG